jgi:S1-C subfamily serine protease
MRLLKLPLSMRQIMTHVFAIFLGVLLTIGTFQLLPSQVAAAPLPNRPAAEIALQASEIPGATSGSFVTAAVNRVGPAVVKIDTERTVTRNFDPLVDDPFFRRFFGEDVLPQVPMERRLRGQGSGFIIDSSGVILTNAHVVNGADKVTVVLKDGRQLQGEVRGIDEVTDLAVVKINASNLPVAPLGNSTTVQVGDWAIAMGNPLGLDNTVTLGIVSTLKRSSVAAGIPDKRLDFIQTDAAINPGNSGGPLLNERGEVIGINTAIRADAMGIGFAIPIDKAKIVATQLIQGQSVAHPYVGIQMITLTPQIAQENNQAPNSPFLVPEINGVLVMGIVPNTPAAKADLRQGDVIVEVEGQPVTRAEELQNIVENSRIGQQLAFKVRRGNQTQQVMIRTAQLQ